MRGGLVGGPGVATAPYSVELANIAGSTPREYQAELGPSGRLEIPSVEEGNYAYRVRNDRGEIVQTGTVRVDRWGYGLDIVLPVRPTRESPAYGTISMTRLAHRPIKAAEKEFRKGQSAAEKGDNEKALSFYARAVEIDPEWYEARVNYGAKLYQARRAADALAQSQAAINIDPASADAYINASAALSMLGNYPGAAQAAARAVELAPQLAKGRYLLGLALLALSRLSEAEAQLRTAGPYGPAQELLTRVAAMRSNSGTGSGR